MLQQSQADADTSTSDRILAATSEVLSRNGMSKLSLSEVATQAGVSRPTLYRWFSSKEELLDAFGTWERQQFDGGVSTATAGLRGNERLDAALRFIVAYQRSYSGVRMVDIEPGHVIGDVDYQNFRAMVRAPQWRRPPPSGSPWRTTSSAATTRTSSSINSATPSASNPATNPQPSTAETYVWAGKCEWKPPKRRSGDHSATPHAAKCALTLRYSPATQDKLRRARVTTVTPPSSLC